MLDDDSFEYLRHEAETLGTGYQLIINAILRTHVEHVASSAGDARPLTAATLRRILREEPSQQA